ncbi:MAG: ATP-binding protein [Ginsengibacter sp.]
MVKSFFDKIANRTRIGFFAAFFLLFISYILTYISTRKVSTQNYWMNHTSEVVHDLDNVTSFTNKGESAFRGYILTNDKSFFGIYHESIKSIDSTLSRLKKLNIDNLVQQRNLDTLISLIDKKFVWIEEILTDHSAIQKDSPLFLERNEEMVSKTKSIEAQVNKMKQEENTLWNERAGEVSEYSGLIQVLNVVSIIIAILLTIYSLIVYNKENRARRLASKKAQEYKEQLQRRVKELAELNTELIELRSLEKYSVTGRIARVIAHEVRNPLTNINLAVEQLTSEMGESPNAEMLLNMINRNSERINQLVSDLLNTTRVSELKFSDISLNDLLDESLGLAKDNIELNKIKVVKSYDQGICPISVDAGKIKIVFLNIIVNAIEAMNTHGILEITTNSEKNNCIVKIADNGKGMTKAEMDRLFEPYFTTKEKGNGLGLANSQNIILGHRGSISANSQPGEGTTFTITFRRD